MEVLPAANTSAVQEMSRRYLVHAGPVEACARGNADQTRRLTAGHSLLTASDVTTDAYPAGAAPPAGQPAQTGTIWYPAARMPSMMAGRAATVWARLPPPSCMITIAPGCRAASTRRAITAAPGLR